MKKYIISFCALSLVSISAFAGDATSPNAGSDSCGLGWQVTQSKTLIGTLTRETTNYFLPGTFSMTTGTSGCTQHPIAKNDVDAVRYVATNYEPLTAEMAEGRGEYVSGLAKLMGCSDVASFGEMTHSQYKSIVSGANVVDTFENVKAEIRKNPGLAASCGV